MHRLYRGGGESSELDGVVKEEMWLDDIREAEEEREGESAMSNSRVGGSSCTLYGCTREPTHGVAGKKAEFCARHGLAASVNVSKECNVDGCSTRAHYGVAGSKKREFCSKHALEGMVSLSHRKCASDGCCTTASFGVPGSKKMEFCFKHALEGMVNLKQTTCMREGCRNGARCGLPGEKKMFCKRHALQGMVSATRRICEHEGCGKRPIYGVAGMAFFRLRLLFCFRMAFVNIHPRKERDRYR